jgi:RNA polymerase sigma-70 factor, ECF subfamily
MSPSRYSVMATEQLLRACAELRDAKAWEEFVARFRRPIALSVLRVAYTRDRNAKQVIDDLVQETYLKLCGDGCHRLLDFAVQHPQAIHGYICTVAVNVARDHFKARHSQKRGEKETDQLTIDIEQPSGRGTVTHETATERRIQILEIERCVDICATGPDRERDRLIFRLHYQQGFSARAIATVPSIGLTAKGVEAVIFRLTRLVRERLVDLRSQRPKESQKDEKGFRPAESY